MESENIIGKIVWIFGSSAAGKETFLRFVQQNQPKTLLRELHWDRQPVVICEESIDWVAQYDSDPLGIRRAEIPAKVVGLANKNNEAVILLKGQELDFENDSLHKLKRGLPDHEHHILFLQVSIDEIMHRLRSKSWRTEKHTKEAMQKWLDSQISILRNLQKDFEVTVVDAEKAQCYSIVRQHML